MGKSKIKRKHRSRSRSREAKKEKKLVRRSRSRSKEKIRKEKHQRHSRHRDRSSSSPDQRGRRKWRSRSRSRSQDRFGRDRERQRQPSYDGSETGSSTSHRSSSESASSMDEETRQKLIRKERKMERKKEKQERRRKKLLMKSNETVEQKRARRLAKKEAKERREKEMMGWDQEMMGYTNVDNPFGDRNLLDTFVWQKKNQGLGLGDRTAEELKKFSREKQIANRLELQKVKERRIQREKEKEERDKELELEQRKTEHDKFKEWSQQEDSFHFQQARLRSKIRIQDGRAKPIDMLAQYINAEDDDDLALEVTEPYKILVGLTVTDLEDLLEDIQVYQKLEKNQNSDFWKNMTIITEDELNKLKKIDPNMKEGLDRRQGINEAVGDEVSSVFKGKSYSQLLILKDQILARIKGSAGSVDIGYWESLLQQLKAHIARAKLKEKHQQRLKTRLAKLREQQGVENELAFIGFDVPIERLEHPQQDLPGKNADEIDIPSDGEGAVEEEKEAEAEANPSTSQGQESAAEEEESEEEEEEEPIINEEDILEQSFSAYESGRYSPTLIKAKSLPVDTLIFDPSEDAARLNHARRLVAGTGDAKDLTGESAFERKARAGMGLDEATFAVEVPDQNKTNYLWSDKYRPRKPRYFNRVHTGFEWNKYNQTHYSLESPPPKIVQGYKFNIFYPDLIDKRKTPEYHITPIKDDPEFGVLRFHAGPPYEDIGFKIVNREWEFSHRHSFRCQFSNGIFQLWFHFKRYRYRR